MSSHGNSNARRILTEKNRGEGERGTGIQLTEGEREKLREYVYGEIARRQGSEGSSVTPGWMMKLVKRINSKR